MTARKRTLASACSPLALASVLAVPLTVVQGGLMPGAFAQEDDLADRIIVTARKREERLVDVPISASVIDGQRVLDEGIRDLRSLFERVPGVEIIDDGAPREQSVVVRGAGSGRLLNSETATGLYRNGAYIAGGTTGGRTFTRMDFFDVERIEVLRGPQGALYGRNAVGGAINITSVAPDFAWGGRGEVAYGTNETLELIGIVNAPIIEDVLAVRGGVEYAEQADGFYTNTLNGDALDAYEYFGVRGSVLFRPTDGFEALLVVDGFYEDSPGAGAFEFNTVGNAFTTQNPFRKAFDTPTRIKIDELNINLQLSYETPIGELSTVTFYKKRDFDLSTDIDGTNEFAGFLSDLVGQSISLTRPGEFERFSQEVRLRSIGDGRLSWQVGAEYLTLSDFFDEDIFIALPGTVFQVDDTVPPLDALPSFQETQIDDWSIAGFGEVTYDITPRTEISGELRVAFDFKSIESFRQQGNDGFAGIQNTVLPGNLAPDQQEFSAVLPSASIRHNVTDEVAVFGRVATGYIPGGYNYQDGVFAAGRPYEFIYGEEERVSFEAGVKTAFYGGALRFDLAGYFTLANEMLVNRQVNDDNGIPINFLQNVGDVELYGIEIDVNALVDVPGIGGTLNAIAGLSLADGEVVNSTGAFSGAAGPFEGLEIPRLRDVQGSLSLIYRRPLFEEIGLFASYNVRGAAGGFFELTNFAEMSDFVLHDIGLGLDGDFWSIRGQIRNLTDNAYEIRGNGFVPAAGGFNNSAINTPRTYMIRLAVEY